VLTYDLEGKGRVDRHGGARGGVDSGASEGEGVDMDVERLGAVEPRGRLRRRDEG
jgi:hypothetical protein